MGICSIPYLGLASARSLERSGALKLHSENCLIDMELN
jgi:hypothetical protein